MITDREIITRIVDLDKRKYRGFKLQSQRLAWEDDAMQLMSEVMDEIIHRRIEVKGVTSYVPKTYLDGIGDEHFGVECQHCKAVVYPGNFCSICGWVFENE